jgi:DNA-binding NtrC family response regulator
MIVALAGAGLSPPLRELLMSRGFDVVEDASDTALIRAVTYDGLRGVVLGVPAVDLSHALDLTRRLKAANPDVRIVVMAPTRTEALLLEALRAGVSDFFDAASPATEVAASLERLLASPGSSTASSPPGASRVANGAFSASRASGRSGASAEELLPDMSRLVGDSAAMREIRVRIAQIARSDASVLITGETGVGKDIIAQLLHAGSRRRARPWVAINCAAIPEPLFESELFGVSRGAYTGAHATRDGQLKAADGGSLFLDEIGDMPLTMQAKILRAVDAREFHRLGSTGRVLFDVRVIAATNQELDQLVASGRFRSDLYYRLNVARLCVPPLRERREDIASLTDHYVGRFNDTFGYAVEGFTDESRALLQRYAWPGNVRELKNVIEATFVGLDGRCVARVDLPRAIRDCLQQQGPPDDEKQRLVTALLSTNWNCSQAARELRWSRMTLYRKLAKYHLASPASRRRLA